MDQYLSLASAAKFAGVTQATMRTWIPKLEGVERDERGGYRIPEHSLRVYLVKKSDRKVKGAVAGKLLQVGGSIDPVSAPVNAGDEIVRLLKDQLQGRTRELEARERELSETRKELRDALNEIRRLEAEMRAHLSGGVVGAVSRWIKGR